MLHHGWVFQKATLETKQIKAWKRRHLGRRQRPVIQQSHARHHAFTTTDPRQRKEELTDFLSNLKPRD